MLKKPWALGIMVFFSLVAHVHAENVIIGRVIGVSDGDTITVLENRTQHKIRLFGIDTPERGQAFGNKAKQFTADLVFGKSVRVIRQDVDRYGRIVGIVYVGNACVNEVLVENGFAWVYRQYCKLPLCSVWFGLEAQAKAGKRGLWADPDPMPPWEFRRAGRKLSK